MAKLEYNLNLTYANKGLQLKTLAVHDVKFHADDVFAAMLLRAIYPGIKVLRTRDDEILNATDIVVDVGLRYDPNNLRFDHHQEGKAGKRENGVEYSGFGLVWKHWGMEICRDNRDVYEEIDRILVQPIDANDNAQALYSEETFKGIHDLNMDGIMSKGFNPNQFDQTNGIKEFTEAMDFAEIVFGKIFESTKYKISLKAKLVKEYEVTDDKRYLVHAEHTPLLAFTREMPELLYYIFPDNVSGDKWYMKCARADGSEFEQRKPLPKGWAGKNNEELEKVSGVSDMLFCHNARFICAAKTKEAILKALDIALSN